MTSEADIKEEIARLTASINQHKSTINTSSYVPRGRGGYRGGNPRGSSYSTTLTAPINRRNNKYVRPGLERSSTAIASGSGNISVSTSTPTAGSASTPPPAAAEGNELSGTSSTATPAAQPSTSSISLTDGKKEVVIGGVAFESSARSLVRKDLPKSKPPVTKPPPTSFPYARKAGHLISTSRTYKPKSGRGRGRNLTLDNTRKSWSERNALRKRRYLNKPCPRFTTTGVLSFDSTFSEEDDVCPLNNIFSAIFLCGYSFLSTGACNRGLTCMYQHDPSKIAICWNFLQGDCPNTAETCNLSHDPTPERTPLCLHFLNKGRCTRVGCLFPHVNVGKRQGVCRDFAVLGYCEKGFDCDKQHVRECPDFAENGTCSTKGCKLPHVIRANRGRKAPAEPLKGMIADAPLVSSPGTTTTDVDSSSKEEGGPAVYAEDGNLGDEFISLTFHESEDEESEEESEDEENDSYDGAENENEEDGGGEDESNAVST